MTHHKISRRDFITAAGKGAAYTVGGMLGVGGVFAPMLAQAGEAVGGGFLDPKPTHYPGKAKSVIWLHMNGAPAAQDLFDYKPDLIKLNNQDVPPSFLEGVQVNTQGGAGKLMASNRTWKQYGQSGKYLSDLLPNLAQQVDELAFIHNMETIGATHDISTMLLNSSGAVPGRPTLGAWITYALGSANPNLPPYIVLSNGGRGLAGGSVNYSAGFLPAVYQGVPIQLGDTPILYLDRPDLLSSSQQRDSLDFLRQVNQRHANRYQNDSELKARLEAYELAYRMQTTVPDVVDVSKESEATRNAYGIGTEETNDYGTNLLRARRLVENGVRFVQVVSGKAGKYNDWDAHSDLEGNHAAQAKMVDKPVAALLKDLKQRGLLDSTLLVWASEFGRTSYGQSGTGRDHNPWGYTQWLAGAGVKGGFSMGQTDAIGLKTVGKAVSTYDFQATVLHAMGLNHLKTTYLYNGRSERPTVVYGEIVKDVFA
ncbi:Protein of unknown function [Hydrocarboniphaga daqingensis]|uniref:Tat (Twin-arginine translocation) pathway signal sequence n=1 Tax=Hydrocarboniphaga daqingensis TaxID=490188 RepID=A0A1M5KMB0_9GAMM|nr:DUF1501 domain-containing protein [Hydrocarboniphaga daqingensis]SHG53875.1 Protein of unknown function [Hydrocarboniphaga daqingensis]